MFVRPPRAGSLRSPRSTEILRVAASEEEVLAEQIDHVEHGGRTVQARVTGAFEISGDNIRAWRDYFDKGGRTTQN
jgi:limonene-1,2-epoxide hydrolase